jgi:hypothetical protein
LRSQYTREKQKERHIRESGEGTFVSKWMHYDKLYFLEEFIVPRQNTSTMRVREQCHL